MTVRSSRLEELANDEHRLRMTPMIDVTFLLLIFFMCTLEFKTLEGKLSAYLPKDSGATERPTEPTVSLDVALRVVDEGSKRHPRDVSRPWSGVGAFQYGPDRRLAYRVGPRPVASLQAVRGRIAAALSADAERRLTIDPGPGATNEDVMRVLDLALEVGYRDITFR